MIMFSENGQAYADERRIMVDTQLIPRGIHDKNVLDAFYSVPREYFVPFELKANAYDDCPLPTKHGQTISQPYIVAYMTELLDLPPDKSAKILEVGTGAGYQAAILAWMGHKVFTVDRIRELVEFAEENLEDLPYSGNIKIKVGDGCD